MSLREYERVMKAAADPTRVRILKLLEGGELCVCQIVAVLELGQSTVSRHLYLLNAAGLVRERQEKKWVYYCLDGSREGPYAGKVVDTLGDWLAEDPTVARDRERAALARTVGPVEICGRGMTLPDRAEAGCCPVLLRRNPAKTGKGRSE